MISIFFDVTKNYERNRRKIRVHLLELEFIVDASFERGLRITECDTFLELGMQYAKIIVNSWWQEIQIFFFTFSFLIAS